MQLQKKVALETDNFSVNGVNWIPIPESSSISEVIIIIEINIRILYDDIILTIPSV